MPERASDKHGRLRDEQMKHEVEGLVRSGHATHAEEWADPEPSAEGDPDVELVPDRTVAGGVPPGVDAEDVEGRSEIARHLQPSVFPADRDRLIRSAREGQAPDSVIQLLKQLSAGREFGNVQDVWSELGGGSERRT